MGRPTSRRRSSDGRISRNRLVIILLHRKTQNIVFIDDIVIYPIACEARSVMCYYMALKCKTFGFNVFA